MEQYRQEHAYTRQCRSLHRPDKHRAEGNAIDHRVHTQPREQPNSAQRLLRQVSMIVGMRVMMLIGRGQIAVRRSAREIVLMKMKPAQ